MRRRLPLILASLMMIPALLVAGCGDDANNNTSTQPQTPTPQTSSTAATSDSADDRAQATLASCKAAADRLPDAQAKDAKQRCQDSYDNIKDATKKIDEKTEEAVKKCKEAAEQIPNADAKANALAACERFQ